MKTLYLLRHAKAVENNAGDFITKDKDRKLSQKGIQDAEMMGERLFSMKIKPCLIISSDANRAFETAVLIAKKIKYDIHQTIVNKEIYSSSLNKLIRFIHETDDEFNSLMLVGHNPAFTELLLYLCKTNISNIPKGGVAAITIPFEEWKKTTKQCGTLLFFDSPKNQ